MPSQSKQQHNLMAMVANNPKAAKRLGIKQSVGQDFLKADKGKKFKEGGMAKDAKLKKLFKGKDTYGEELKEAKAIKSGKITPAEYARGEKDIEGEGKPKAFKKGGGVTAKVPSANKMGSLGMKKGGACKYADGGNVKQPAVSVKTKASTEKEDVISPDMQAQMRKQVQEYRTDKGTQAAAKKAMGFARGGGIEVKGKTKGKFR